MKSMIAPIALAMALLGAAAQGDDAVVAKVGAREVKASEITPYLDALSPAERTALSKSREDLARYVRAVLLRAAVLQDAKSAGWDKKPEVEAAADRARDQFVAESYLAEVSQVPSAYPPEADLKAAYEAERDKLKLPRRYELSQIYVAADAPRADAARKEIAEIASKLKSSPGDFGKLAREKSDEKASASRDGKIGWLAEDAIAPEIRKGVAGLQKGQVSAPIEAGDGFHIVKVDDLREAGPASYEEAKADLAALLRQRRAALNRDALVSSLLSRQPISVNELALESLQKNP